MAILYSAKRYTGIEESGAITGSGGGASVTISDTAPSSPTAGDLWFNSASLKTFVYYNDGSSSQWLPSNPVGLRGPTGNAGLTVQTSDTAPSNPSNGDVWFDTSVAKTFIYYTDSDSSQWIQMNPSTSVTSSAASTVTQYSNVASFSSSNNTIGDFAVALDTKALYMWDGTEWDRISSGINESPIFSTEPASEYELTTTGTATTITIAASDPEGFPIVYDHVTNPSNQTQATITNNGGTFTITPSTNTAHAGSFTCRFRASDGTHVSSRTSTFSLSFYNGYATQYLALTSGNLTTVSYSGSGTDSLNSIIDAASDGDALLLDPGVYELDPTNWDGYNSSNWRGKAIAIVGKTKDPADVVLNLNDAGAREKPIFSEGTVPTDHDHHFANMRVVRLGVPNPAADNYRSALRRGDGGGYLQNCIVDLNGNPVSWVYSAGSTRYGSFINCSFVNYSSWLTNYNGDHSRVRITDCAFAGGYNSSVSALGTNQTSVSFGAGYTYTDNGSTYGHMKGILTTPTVSISAP